MNYTGAWESHSLANLDDISMRLMQLNQTDCTVMSISYTNVADNSTDKNMEFYPSLRKYMQPNTTQYLTIWPQLIHKVVSQNNKQSCEAKRILGFWGKTMTRKIQNVFALVAMFWTVPVNTSQIGIHLNLTQGYTLSSARYCKPHVSIGDIIHTNSIIV